MSSRPQLDSVPDPPEDWDSIPLGAGQEPNAYGGRDSFQHSRDRGVLPPNNDVRRNPDETFEFVSRVPERW